MTRRNPCARGEHASDGRVRLIGLLADAASSLQSFVCVFTSIYILLIFAYVLLSWIHLPYSSVAATLQRFLDEVCRPYLGLFRGRIPAIGPLDLSPIVAVVVLLVAAELVKRPDRGSAVGGQMPLTPVEIRHIQLRRAWLRGYRRKPVDQLFEEIADSFEDVWRERADLSDRLEELEGEAAKHRELEALLRSTLVSAERAAQDMKEQARRESDLIVQEAHAESRRVSREAAAEKRRLEEDIVKIRAQLRAAFESLGDWPGDKPSEEKEAATVVTRPTPVAEAGEGGIRKVAG